MSVVPTAADAPLDPADARADERRGLLREMAQIGLRIARTLEREAEAAAAAPPPEADAEVPARRVDEVARAFAQVARAVSLALALEEKIDQDRARRPLEAEALALKRRALAARVADSESETGLTRRRALVAGAVEQAIDADPSARAPQRAADLRTRLDRMLACEAADFDAFMHRPAGEIVARICRDLGLEPDWSLWEAPWAAQAERAAARAPARRAPPPRPPAAGPPPEPFPLNGGRVWDGGAAERSPTLPGEEGRSSPASPVDAGDPPPTLPFPH